MSVAHSVITSNLLCTSESNSKICFTYIVVLKILVFFESFTLLGEEILREELKIIFEFSDEFLRLPDKIVRKNDSLDSKVTFRDVWF